MVAKKRLEIALANIGKSVGIEIVPYGESESKGKDLEFYKHMLEALDL